ncbi:DUF2332 family protein [bacterium]|nr:DUF2332 family protein [bacterium]
MVLLLDLGNDPARQLALELCRREDVAPYFGLLFVENVARILFHCLGSDGVSACLQKDMSLAQVLSRCHPSARHRWREKLRRELAQPYGDRQVFVSLERVQQRLPEVLAVADSAWICGSYANGHFSPNSDLDVAVLVKDPARRLKALSLSAGRLSLFVLPLEPALEKVEMVLCGALVPLPLDRSLAQHYWEVLKQNGFAISPYPRVVGGPLCRVREVPLWLENHFKRSHRKRHRGLFWGVTRELGYRLPGAARFLRRVVPLPVAAPLMAPLSASFLRLAHEADTPAEYAVLARHLAHSPPDWLQVLPGQSPARLFFAVVRYLGGAPLQPEAFLEWCQSHQTGLQEVLGQRRLQVNAVRRCAPLVAGLSWIQRQTPETPLQLVEFGAAAGLLLNFPHYRIDYSNSQSWGPADAELSLSCKTQGDFQLGPVSIEHRLGLDRQPLDLSKDADCAWLRAQTWGSSRLEQALLIARQHPPKLSSEELEVALSSLPPGRKVVFHSHCVNQLNCEERRQLDQTCRGQQAVRLSLEWEDALYPLLRVTDPEGESRLLAVCPPRQLHWVDTVR